MPRPVKCRKVCHFPNVLEFLPADNTEKKIPVVLTVDEYETSVFWTRKAIARNSAQYLCRSQEQRFNEFTRLPGRE